MDPNRVASLVDGLTSTFEAGLAFYTKWKQKQERENNYQRSPLKRSSADSKCSLVASLDISSHRIKATYQVGFAFIGPEFAIGDTICRDCLWTNLSRLGDCVEVLRRNILARHPGPLNLYDIIHVSEATRHSCIAALAEQYTRQACGRAIPQQLPVPNLRSSNRPNESSEESSSKPPPAQEHDRVEFDRQTAVCSTSSAGPPVFQFEPPSPPLTPRLQPDDSVSAAGISHSRTHSDPLRPDDSISVVAGASSHFHFHPPRHLNIPPQPGAAARTSRRPINSVFSIFCPEAMALQVNPSRTVPTHQQPHCRCGYAWDATSLGEEGGVLLKDGFRMTQRFLAKSHCDQLGDGAGQHGYGCVLCTSSGRTETYGTAEMLRVHVNAAHTKWQMLHDRDMA